MINLSSKTLILLISLGSLPFLIRGSIFFKKHSPLPHSQLLEEWKQKIEIARLKEIERLSQDSQSLTDKERADELRKLTRLDHIKVCYGDEVFYLQLQKSMSGFVFGNYYPYDEKLLNEQLVALYADKVQLEVTTIKVYRSTKMRPLWGTVWLFFLSSRDLYSAQITVSKK